VVIDWLLDGDPAIRWQTLHDLTDAPQSQIDAERARVEREGWGARLLAAEDPDGLWASGACFLATRAAAASRRRPLAARRPVARPRALRPRARRRAEPLEHPARAARAQVVGRRLRGRPPARWA
jgi:hypothetical protein